MGCKCETHERAAERADTYTLIREVVRKVNGDTQLNVQRNVQSYVQRAHDTGSGRSKNRPRPGWEPTNVQRAASLYRCTLHARSFVWTPSPLRCRAAYPGAMGPSGTRGTRVKKARLPTRQTPKILGYAGGDPGALEE